MEKYLNNNKADLSLIGQNLVREFGECHRIKGQSWRRILDGGKSEANS